MTTATPKAAGVPATFGWRLPWVLGLGAFGLAFSITTTAAYLPPLLGRFTDSRTMIAAVLAAEGIFALTLPVVIGPWSDTFHTPLGRRRPFMLAALGPMGFCLALMAFMPSLWTTTLIVLAFFFAYYVYEPPYRGLYPDLLPPSAYGRSQGIQHVLRGLALGLALVGGGFLFHVWQPAPFLIAAFVTTLACGAAIVFVVRGRRPRPRLRGRPRLRRAQLADHARRTPTCGAGWRPTRPGRERSRPSGRSSSSTSRAGSHQPLSTSSAVLGTVAAGYMIAAVFSGPLGDRVGLARVIFVASFVYGGGLLVAGFASSWQDWYYALVFPVAIAGGAVMTLAWGLLFMLMPEGQRGAISGLATWTKGFGLIAGPLIAGALIDVLSPYLPATDGYQVLWPICAVPILAVIPLVWMLMRAEARSRASARTA